MEFFELYAILLPLKSFLVAIESLLCTLSALGPIVREFQEQMRSFIPLLQNEGSSAIAHLILRRFAARILTNNHLEVIAFYSLTSLGYDKLCEVKKGFETKGYQNKLLAWRPEPFALRQMELRSIIVNLTSMILNAQ
jgi:hypothetical protein